MLLTFRRRFSIDLAFGSGISYKSVDNSIGCIQLHRLTYKSNQLQRYECDTRQKTS